MQIRIDENRTRVRATEIHKKQANLLFFSLKRRGKISLDEVVLTDASVLRSTKAYFVLTEAFKRHHGISDTNDFHKAVITAVAFNAVPCFAPKDPFNITNQYVPNLNGDFSLQAALAILEDGRFQENIAEKLIHIYDALRGFGRIPLLKCVAECSDSDWAFNVSMSPDNGLHSDDQRVLTNATILMERLRSTPFVR